VNKYALAIAAVLALAPAAGSARAGTNVGTTGGGDGRAPGGHACYTPPDGSGIAAPTPPEGPVLAGRKPGASSGTGV
jgi:hypothetical protein